MMTDGPPLACRCGTTVFTVRANAVESVGLATCDQGHSSLLLDSRDVWAHVIQAARPRELCCRCKQRTFHLTVDYHFRDGTRTVRAFVVRARCATCAAGRNVFSADIDYEPTDALIERPLDPVDDPWRKARWVRVTGLWKREDMERLLRFVSTLPDARIAFASWQQAPRDLTVEAAVLALREAQTYNIVFANEDVTLPMDLSGAWRDLPLVHVGAPTAIHYDTGDAELYYVSYALERFAGGAVIPQPAAFLALAARVRAWLASEFVSARGKNTADNPAEYQRLKGGW
ncbi:MAG: hypothetical protein ACLP1X_01660 [Polyangiaceae bacterium]